jgi:aspartate/methionine/tyrosine aminotransferase
MHELAVALNAAMEGTVAEAMLSPFGRRMYFPKGIIAQCAQAQRCSGRHNATAGVAMSFGQTMFLRDIYDQFVPGAFSPNEIFNYAPVGGDPRLRELWRASMLAKNPSLQSCRISTPVVTAGLTHAISLASMMFVGPGDRVVIPDLRWDNYDLILSDLCQAEVRTFELFDRDMRFNVDGMRAALAGCGEQARLLLNFPNNPTGYTPSVSEMRRIAEALVGLADQGMQLLVLCDDAYFGLFYEADTCMESPFAYLANAHENLLAVKCDAATKEDMVWGFRLGFLTFGGKGLSEAAVEALGQKTLGAIRGTVSSCDRPGQSLLIRAMERGATYQADHECAREEMERRYRKFREALRRHSDSRALVPYPFNSGYFMSFRCAGNAEALRLRLLDHYQVGTVAISGRTLRVAYCSVECDDIDDLVDVIFTAAEETWK